MENTTLKKFLFISYYYPPIQAIASMRSWKLAKYIREFGWEPIVMASASESNAWGSPLPDVRVERIENKLFLQSITKNTKEKLTPPQSSDASPTKAARPSYLRNKVFEATRSVKRALEEIFAYPDGFADWRRKTLIRGREILLNEKVELILSTGGPFSSHIVASKLSKETGIPWIADYRDLWTLNSCYNNSKLRRFFECRLERSALQNASKIVTISNPLASMQASFLGMPVYTVTNGFDQGDYSKQVKADTTLSIVYTGILYEGYRTPSALFEALRLLLQKNLIETSKLEIHFYGANKPYLQNLLMGTGLDDMVHLHDSIPFEECVRRQQSATILLFLNWNDLEQKGLYSGKIFEYLGARRPILAFPRNPDSVVDQLLERTNAGVLCDTPEEIATQLKEWYDTFYSFDELPYNGVDDEILKFDRRNQARQFAELFDQATC